LCYRKAAEQAKRRSSRLRVTGVPAYAPLRGVHGHAKCNVREAGVAYHHGDCCQSDVSPYGVYDMCGNVCGFRCVTSAEALEKLLKGERIAGMLGGIANGAGRPPAGPAG
jgi:hypothetical protein